MFVDTRAAKAECQLHVVFSGKDIAMKGTTHACLIAILLLAPAMAAAQTQQPAPPAERAPAGAKITKEQATKVALEQVPGKVTDVTIERKHGKNVYVVEIQSPDRGEKDVLVDMESGKVIGTE
jgi:uncharacterized membrane protein YkoI